MEKFQTNFAEVAKNFNAQTKFHKNEKFKQKLSRNSHKFNTKVPLKKLQ
jgi:hypothetical protein